MKSPGNIPDSGRPLRLAIIHWLPVELYPPTINLVRYFSGNGRWKVSVHSSANHLGRPGMDVEGVRILRSAAPGKRKAIGKVLAYLSFYLGVWVELVRGKPDVILQVEPQSAPPVAFYRIIRRSVAVFVHHHEYHDPHQFLRPGMLPARFGHFLETRLIFPRARWISHTNAERLALFHKDHPGLPGERLHILPNYPPAAWTRNGMRADRHNRNGKLRFVYIGSLSLDDTYLEAFIEWLRSQPDGAASLDIYAYNFKPSVRSYLDRIDLSCIRFYPEGMAYDSLPECLANYDVGLLLYRANTTNYRYNASNKLFEYLACGLDVIYPEQMRGVPPYVQRGTIPRVIEWDFENLPADGLQQLRAARSAAPSRKYETAESVLIDLEDSMIRSLSYRQ
jgi:hypothetical protein